MYSIAARCAAVAGCVLSFGFPSAFDDCRGVDPSATPASIRRNPG
jgi:hypothetical protein